MAGWRAALLACGLLAAPAIEAAPALELVSTIPLAGVKGRIDHMSADVKGHRLFVAALGNDTVEVLDTRGAAHRSLAGFGEPQGVLAQADPLPEAAFEDLARVRRGAAPPFLVALDGVTDPHNLGALLRSAECAGVTGVILPRHRAAHVTPAVTKAAAGAAEYVAMTVVAGLPSALGALKELGVWTVGLDADAPTSIFDLEVATEPVALVLGAEGRGLSRLVRQRCDLVVGIPQSGATSSLNVAAAGAVACFEIVRRRQAT